jgi:hypothetical protein
MKRFFLHITLLLIVLFSGADFVLKTHHIFTEHHHEGCEGHSEEHQHHEDDCKVCDWAVAAFLDVQSEELNFVDLVVFVAKNTTVKSASSESFIDFSLLRGPPSQG